jgi:oligoribonuclease NrnB/cAMP/cGMP phosphodiesterase (DHH superfamily)
MTMLVFHHNDADGRCAAAIVNKWFLEEVVEREKQTTKTISFVEMDYKTHCPFDKINAGERVVIVDFSFQPDVMSGIVARSGSWANIVWCDHHATAKDYAYPADGYCDFTDKGLSGCECTWKHFFGDIPIPSTVSLLGDYDAWRLQRKDCFAFYEGLKTEDQSPVDGIWSDLLDTYDDGRSSTISAATCKRIISQGNAVIKYRDNYCGEIVKAFGYETEIGGHQAFATNLYRFGSGGFGELFHQYPICIAYIHDGTKFTVSLYSETVDVSEIAKKYGGGGHKGAAGFVCTSLPWSWS